MFIHQKSQGQQKGCDLRREKLLAGDCRQVGGERIWNPDARQNLGQGGPQFLCGQEGRGVGELEGAQQEAEVLSFEGLHVFAEAPGKVTCRGRGWEWGERQAEEVAWFWRERGEESKRKELRAADGL